MIAFSFSRRALGAGLVLVLLLISTPLTGTARAEPLGCGSVITEDTTLQADVGPCPDSDGLIVRASNITINLNGHSVIGALRVFGPAHWQKAATGQFAGIRLGRVSGVSVVNGTVEQFAAGVVLFNSSGNTLSGLNIHDNIGPPNTDTLGDGIVLFGSSDNLVARNTVRHNGPFSGIAFVGPSNDNKVLLNGFLDNNLPNVNGSDQASRHEDGRTIESDEDFGVRIEGPAASRNVVNQNLITGNGVAGVHISPSCTPHPLCHTTPGPNADNVITANQVRRNGFGYAGTGLGVPGGRGDGILVYTTNVGRRQLGKGYAPGTRTVIERNEVRGNARHGIIIFQDSTYNKIRNNSSVDNQVLGGGHDGRDNNPDCATNTWLNNSFGTVNRECVNGQTGKRPVREPAAEDQEETEFTPRWNALP